jgi:hypothetical protein
MFVERFQRKSRATAKAAPAASPPIIVVCNPPRHIGIPVKRALMQPKINRAVTVTATEATRPV